MPAPTPGQIARQAYWQALRRCLLPWWCVRRAARLTAWEAAAQAVREDYARSQAIARARAADRQARWGMGPRDLDITYHEESL